MSKKFHKIIGFGILLSIIFFLLGSNTAIEKLDKADYYYTLASDQWNENNSSFDNPKDVIKNLTFAIHFLPHESTFYSDRATAYIQLNEYEKALSDLNQAININPEKAILYHNRSIYYLKIKDFNNSIKDSKKACLLGDCEVNYYLNKK